MWPPLVCLGALFAYDRLAHHVGAEEANRLGWESADPAPHEWVPRPLVAESQCEARQDLAPDHAGPHPVPAPSHAVEDVIAPAQPAEDRQAVLRAVDRSRPIVRNGHVG